MLHWSKPSLVSPSDVAQHPKKITMVSFRQFDDCPVFVVPVGYSGKVDTEYFYCRICKKWLCIRSSSGNLFKHLRRKHPEMIQEDDEEKSYSVEDVIAAAKRFILLNGLPFSLVDDPNFKILCPFLERHQLSNYATTLSDLIQENLKGYLQNALMIYLSVDEWSSTTNQPFLGISAYCLFEDDYEVFTLDHKMLINEHNPAEILAFEIFQTIQDYGIEEQYQGFVSDTTPLMPATNECLCQAIESTWHPCFCHIINLFLSHAVTAAENLLKPMFQVQKYVARSHAFHNYLASTDSSCKSLPSYTPTRWYSLYGLMKNFIDLQPYICHFVEKEEIEIEDFDEEIFENVKEFLHVIATAKTAIEDLESSSFGTISLVIPYFQLIKQSFDHLDDEKWGSVKEVFIHDYSTKYIELLSDEMGKELVIATRLNPMMNRFLNSSQSSFADDLIREAIESPPVHSSNSSQTSFGLNLSSQPDEPRQDQLSWYIQNLRSMTDKTIDLFRFWKDQADVAPELSEFALLKLLPPASSAETERLFSKTGKAGNKYRSRLKPAKLRDLAIILGNKEASSLLIE